MRKIIILSGYNNLFLLPSYLYSIIDWNKLNTTQSIIVEKLNEISLDGVVYTKSKLVLGSLIDYMKSLGCEIVFE